jgi:hypothetical protein
MMQHLSTFLAILTSPPPFDDPKDKTICEMILNSFSGKEAEEIANASYAYWIVSSKIPKNCHRMPKKILP